MAGSGEHFKALVRSHGTGDDEGFGSAFVVRGTDGNLSGEVESVTGPNAHVCGLEFEAALPFGDAWLWTDTDTEPDDEGNRCQVLFRVEDASTLRIDSRNCSLYCGVQGTFDAVYAREK